MGPLSLHEKIVAATFVVMVLLWGLAGTLKLDLTAVAFLGLGVLLATGVLTLKDIGQQGDVLATFIWFAILYTLSGQLNALGFMGYLGQRLGGALGGLPWLAAYAILVVAYVAPPLSLREPDGARPGPVRRLPRGRGAARRAGAAAGLRASLRDELHVRRSRPRLRARTCWSSGADT